jgi:hypothetical protein
MMMERAKKITGKAMYFNLNGIFTGSIGVSIGFLHDED